jgi:pilus assembly protein Flp/PilA
MFTTLVLLIQNLRGDKRGVTALEYGLIASLVAVVIISAVSLLGNNLSTTFNKIATTL